mgnify:CR=1 FL=1
MPRARDPRQRNRGFAKPQSPRPIFDDLVNSRQFPLHTSAKFVR